MSITSAVPSLSNVNFTNISSSNIDIDNITYNVYNFQGQEYKIRIDKINEIEKLYNALKNLHQEFLNKLHAENDEITRMISDAKQDEYEKNKKNEEAKKMAQARQQTLFDLFNRKIKGGKTKKHKRNNRKTKKH